MFNQFKNFISTILKSCCNICASRVYFRIYTGCFEIKVIKDSVSNNTVNLFIINPVFFFF